MVNNMTEETLIKTINILLLAAGVFLIEGLIMIEPHSHMTGDGYSSKDLYSELPKTEWWNEDYEEHNVYNKIISDEADLRNHWMNITVTYSTIETEYAGVYYITAYCPWECGYNGNNYPAGWRTSSGAICHYSDERYEPTTCAIDRSYHHFGEYLMVDDKIYVTEDTGPGVRGRWIDVFVESMDEVHSFSSHYTDVYYVEFITHQYTKRYLFDLLGRHPEGKIRENNIPYYGNTP